MYKEELELRDGREHTRVQVSRLEDTLFVEALRFLICSDNS